MNIGDLKYTFTNLDGAEETVVVPAEVMREGKRAGLNTKLAIQKYLYDLGKIAEDPTEGVDTTKPATQRKRTRKPNDTKAALITAVTNVLATEFGAVNVVNPERQVQVVIDGKTYEFTLVQKRK